MGHKTVLIVDDSRVSRMMIKAIVVDLFPEWNIIEAANGDDALEKVSNVQVIDIMILDFNMPGMDGLTLAEILKVKYPKAQLSLLTANIQESIQRKADKLGIGFVKKPVTQEKIEGIIAYA